MIPKSAWKWFGNAGHFICSRWCRFHLTTEVGKFVISTVGEYVHPSNSGGSESVEAEWLKENRPGADIGAGGKYETMVFEIISRCGSLECQCGLPTHNGSELDGVRYMTAKEATDGHYNLCIKYAKLQNNLCLKPANLQN